MFIVISTDTIYNCIGVIHKLRVVSYIYSFGGMLDVLITIYLTTYPSLQSVISYRRL